MSFSKSSENKWFFRMQNEYEDDLFIHFCLGDWHDHWSKSTVKLIMIRFTSEKKSPKMTFLISWADTGERGSISQRIERKWVHFFLKRTRFPPKDWDYFLCLPRVLDSPAALDVEDFDFLGKVVDSVMSLGFQTGEPTKKQKILRIKILGFFREEEKRGKLRTDFFIFEFRIKWGVFVRFGVETRPVWKKNSQKYDKL